MAGASFTTVPAPKPPKPIGPPVAQPRSSPKPPRAQRPPVPVGRPFAEPQTSHPAPPAAAPQAAPAAAPQSTPTPPAAASPLDSTYFDNIAANQLKVGNQINALTAQSANLGTSLQAALAQLAYQQPRDQLKLEQAANKAGALYSSVYDQNLGNLSNTYLTKQAGLTDTEGQKAAAIAAQIGALNQGVPAYNAQQYDAAVARAVKAAAANPATGQAPAVPTATPGTPAVPAATPARGAAQWQIAPAPPKSTPRRTVGWGTMNQNGNRGRRR